jgi:hypothetical protein
VLSAVAFAHVPLHLGVLDRERLIAPRLDEVEKRIEEPLKIEGK